MGITSSGPICDVCGEYILLDPAMEQFKVTGIEGVLICHTKCKQTLIDCGSDWRKLPDGRLRKAFEDADSKEAGR